MPDHPLYYRTEAESKTWPDDGCRLPQACIYQVAPSGTGLSCTNDKAPHTQEPDEFREPSPVLKPRRGQRCPPRLQLSGWAFLDDAIGQAV